MSCKKHFNWITDTPCPYCRIDELEQQLAEARDSLAKQVEALEKKAHEEIGELKAEIARLTEEANNAVAIASKAVWVNGTCSKHVGYLFAGCHYCHIQELEKQLAQANKSVWKQLCDAAVSQRNELAAKNAKLVEALEKIADSGCWFEGSEEAIWNWSYQKHPRDIAAAALKEVGREE